MRPLGWRWDSHRHALAARGIRTNYYSKKRYDALVSYRVPEKFKKEEPLVVRREVPVRMETQEEHTISNLLAGRGRVTDPDEREILRRLLLSELETMKHARYTMSEYMHNPESGVTESEFKRAEARMDRALDVAKKVGDRLEPPEGGYFMKKYMAFKKDNGLLAEHKMVEPEEAYRNNEVAVFQQQVEAKLRKASAKGESKPDKDEEFICNDFKVQSEDFMNGRITKSVYHDNVNRLLARHLQQNSTSLDIWGWANKK
jgi:hypothetical protein